MFADELKFFCIKQFDPDLDHVTWIYTVMITGTGIYSLVATTVNMINIKQVIHKVSGDNTWYEQFDHMTWESIGNINSRGKIGNYLFSDSLCV